MAQHRPAIGPACTLIWAGVISFPHSRDRKQVGCRAVQSVILTGDIINAGPDHAAHTSPARSTATLNHQHLHLVLVLTLSLISTPTSTSSLATLPVSQWPVSCIHPDTRTLEDPSNNVLPPQENKTEQNKRVKITVVYVHCFLHNVPFSLYCVTYSESQFHWSQAGHTRFQLTYGNIYFLFDLSPIKAAFKSFHKAPVLLRPPSEPQPPRHLPPLKRLRETLQFL